ncbi:uncharacterized protein LOC132842658 isoform X1 [Tachysurus vachellii]|uniref:uncharacterized protein LOC132842658 isoform X1 n=1 Tax=Tachysurus vachellii TaxID=175792 RepID=UPI00296B0819|nr:uncharacterized protein LOC132842658 isoform X1 [Tachysurus vachellii]XP_060721432.1 uncharacterized protein LOC132842658 isoform X1 [Tachysurus vachellii]
MTLKLTALPEKVNSELSALSKMDDTELFALSKLADSELFSLSKMDNYELAAWPKMIIFELLCLSALSVFSFVSLALSASLSPVPIYRPRAPPAPPWVAIPTSSLITSAALPWSPVMLWSLVLPAAPPWPPTPLWFLARPVAPPWLPALLWSLSPPAAPPWPLTLLWSLVLLKASPWSLVLPSAPPRLPAMPVLPWLPALPGLPQHKLNPPSHPCYAFAPPSWTRVCLCFALFLSAGLPCCLLIAPPTCLLLWTLIELIHSLVCCHSYLLSLLCHWFLSVISTLFVHFPVASRCLMFPVSSVFCLVLPACLFICFLFLINKCLNCNWILTRPCHIVTQSANIYLLVPNI